MAAGVLPVYYGAPNVWDHVPPRSIIHVDDFPSCDALAAHLKAVLRNASLYASYHAWRKDPLPRWFQAKYGFTRVHSECRTCRWADAKRRGLGWDRKRQRAHAGEGIRPRR